MGLIYIKKANRGKFTEYCGGKVTNECINKGKNSSDPKVRKRATFAANARKWNKKEGGKLKNNKMGLIYKKVRVGKAQNGGVVKKRPYIDTTTAPEKKTVPGFMSIDKNNPDDYNYDFIHQAYTLKTPEQKAREAGEFGMGLFNFIGPGGAMKSAKALEAIKAMREARALKASKAARLLKEGKDLMKTEKAQYYNEMLNPFAEFAGGSPGGNGIVEGLRENWADFKNTSWDPRGAGKWMRNAAEGYKEAPIHSKAPFIGGVGAMGYGVYDRITHPDRIEKMAAKLKTAKDTLK